MTGSKVDTPQYEGKGHIVLTDDGIEYCDCLTGDEEEVFRRSTKHEDFLHEEWLKATKRVEQLETLINTPEVEDFVKAIKLEMPHQVERWGKSHDEDKTSSDWIRLGTHLLGKASMADWNGDAQKLKHHIITTAAAMGNFHAAILKTEADHG